MYAHRHPTFRETIPAKHASVHRYILWFYVIQPLAAIAGIWLLTLWLSLMVEKNAAPFGILFTVLILLLWYGGVLLFDAMMGTVGINWRLPRTIRVRRCYLIIDTPLHRERHRLRDCRWFPGSTSVTHDVFSVPERPAIIIEIPHRDRYRVTGYSIRRRERRIAVGFTPEGRERWVGLLTLGCQRRSVVTVRDSLMGMVYILGLAALAFGAPLMLRLFGY